MDNQPAETFEQYSIENPGGIQSDVRFGTCSGTCIDVPCRVERNQ
jgi:hypothetical protein